MQLVYGTTNPSKLKHMRDMLVGLELEIIGLDGFAFDPVKIEEAGRNPLENAKIKALAYHNSLKRPVFSCDSGLYIDGLPPHLQPGVHIRRVNGKELNDAEMLVYYAGLAEKLGGNVKARYRNAICLVVDSETIYEDDGADLASVEFLLTSVPHPTRRQGFPLDSLSLHCETGKYYFDLATKEETKSDALQAAGFRRFFARALMGKQLS